MHAERARTVVLTVWLLVSGLVCALLIAICLVGTSYRGIYVTVWLWFGVAYLPSLILALIWLRSGRPAHSASRRIKSGAFVGSLVLEIFYLLVASATILTQPFSHLEASQLLRLSYFWLVPLQAIAAGILFLTLARQDKTELHTDPIPGALATELSGHDFKQLEEALLSAFPDISSLQRLTRIGLDENLESIAGATTLARSVFELIVWTSSRGRLQELVRKAHLENPGNPKLREFAEQFLQLPLEVHEPEETAGTSTEQSP